MKLAVRSIYVCGCGDRLLTVVLRHYTALLRCTYKGLVAAEGETASLATPVPRRRRGKITFETERQPMTMMMRYVWGACSHRVHCGSPRHRGSTCVPGAGLNVWKPGEIISGKQHGNLALHETNNFSLTLPAGSRKSEHTGHNLPSSTLFHAGPPASINLIEHSAVAGSLVCDIIWMSLSVAQTYKISHPSTSSTRSGRRPNFPSPLQRGRRATCVVIDEAIRFTG